VGVQMLVLLAYPNQGLASQPGRTDATGGQGEAPSTLEVADDDGRVPGVAA